MGRGIFHKLAGVSRIDRFGSGFCLVILFVSMMTPNLVSAQGSISPFSLSWSSSETFEPSQTSSIAWGDYDGDGDLDLAVANGHPTYGPKRNELYRNDDGILTMNPVWVTAEVEISSSVAWGDYDEDGDLDLVVGNWSGPNRLYRNDNGVFSLEWSSIEVDATYSVAWGDYDGDGDLDLAVGNENQPNRLYRNNNGGLILTWSSIETDATNSIVWEDYDSDNDLDLAVGNGHPSYGGQPNRVYRNDNGTLLLVWSSAETDYTQSLAWGDYDSDGDMDLAVGNGNPDFSTNQVNRLYRNNDGNLALIWTSPEIDSTSSLAWGDFDSDNDLDLLVGNGSFTGQSNRIYRNDGGQLTLTWSSFEAEDTRTVAWGDYDKDHKLDIAVGNDGQPNRIYRNNNNLLTTTPAWSSNETDGTNDLAWGDYDGDGDLDLATGNGGQANRLYRNNEGILTLDWSTFETDSSQSIAWGDYDGDGDLDLAVGNWGQSNRLYRNNGSGILTLAWSSFESSSTTSIVWGDYDSDGDLDLAVGNHNQPNQLYRNDNGILVLAWLSDEIDDTLSVTWGDYDGDGDLDLAAGATDVPIRLYQNDSGSLTTNSVWFPLETNNTWSVTWGDYDGDGDLDLAVGNSGQPNRLYRNNEGNLTTEAVWSSLESSFTLSVTWGDYDGDGDLDLAAGNSLQPNQLYRNDNGILTSSAVWLSDDADETYSIAWGDYDGDGDLDLAAGNKSSQPNRLYRNNRDALRGLSPLPIIALTSPGSLPEADFFSTSQIWSEPTIPFTYTLFHPRGIPVKSIHAFYSLNGGGNWTPAIAANSTITTNLATNLNGRSQQHTFMWDTFASGFFGQSDNVVFRIEAIPAIVNMPNQIPGPYLYGSYGTNTFPFRVRGTQVRVLNDDMQSVPNAIVYRLPTGQTAGGTLLRSNNAVPFFTNSQGYLQGRGQIDLGDRLLALAPVDWTETIAWGVGLTETMYLYYTDGTPTGSGLDSFTVSQPGVQTLRVSPDNPLILFDLDISLEWDAHNDPVYLQQLEFDIKKASEYLYDFTNGQVALGDVTVFQNTDHWLPSHVVIYSTNRLRPLAIEGGIVLTETIDPQNDDIRYNVGQVIMGATWNRYGNPGQNIGEDWPLTLAHELAHYLLFQEDVYFGLNEVDLLKPVDSCTGSAMGDIYNPDNSEFLTDDEWLPKCSESFAHQTLQRSEWATARLWYPWLKSPAATHTGPQNMPFNLTTVNIVDPITPTEVIEDPTIFLDYVGDDVSSSGGRAVLIRDDLFIFDLGSPVGGQNRLLARGARLGDRLCVFDPPRRQYGCETISLNDERLSLAQDNNWTPLIRLSPVTSLTFTIEVSGLPQDLPLQARLYPEFGEGSDILSLNYTDGAYSGIFNPLLYPGLTGHVQIWVDEAHNPRREAIVAYAVGGNPGGDLSRWPASRGANPASRGANPQARGNHPASRGANPASRGANPASRGANPFARNGHAPMASTDGQLIFFTRNPTNFQEGELYSIQNMAGLPPLPTGKVALGSGYNLAISPNIVDPVAGSISFQYLDINALVEGVDETQLLIHFWDGSQWLALETIRDSYFNLVSAVSQGPGIYALLAGVTQPSVTAYSPAIVTNDHNTVLDISGTDFLGPVKLILAGATSFTLPVTVTNETLISVEIPAGLPAQEYQLQVRNGDGGEVWLPGSLSIFDPQNACFYDNFESGPNKWQREGEWGIVSLESERAMTDSPTHPYQTAPDSGTTQITAITTLPFDLNDCPNPVLTFRHAYEILKFVEAWGSSQDVGRLELSIYDETLKTWSAWDTLEEYHTGIVSGLDTQEIPSNEWQTSDLEDAMIDLSSYTGTVRLRFSLEADDSISGKGWIIDDVVVQSEGAKDIRIILPIIIKAP